MTSPKDANMDGGGRGGGTRRHGQGHESLDATTRKPSFKCGGPRSTHRSVRALTNQFDRMSGQQMKSKPSESISEQPCLHVRNAINIFEKVSPGRPIAAVKPICKPKLVPKDSLCRARYNDMRRTSKVAKVKLNDAAEQTGETDKMNNCDKNKEPALDPNVANWEEREPYTVVQLRKQLSEKSLQALKNRLGKENISVQTPEPKELIHANQSAKNVDESPTNLHQSPNNEGDNQSKTVEINQPVVSDNASPTGMKEMNQSQHQQPQYSSVFSQISQTQINKLETKERKERKFVALLRNKEPTRSDEEEQQVKTPPENMKPNMSFLWSAKSQPENLEKSLSSTINETPLPKPPENFLPDCCLYESISGRSESTDTIYDDIGGPDVNQSLYCISDDLFNIYEDIGSARGGEREHVCEEAIYGDAVYHSICGESVQSSYEKNNSLYESAESAAIGSELLGTNGGEVLKTHMDDDSTSDEWLEESDSEPEPFQINRRSKRPCGGKTRPKWAELQKRANEKTINTGDQEHKNVALEAYDFTNERDCVGPKILFTIPRPALRKRSRPVPSLRTFLYRTDNRDCQEASLFVEEDISAVTGDEEHFYESIPLQQVTCENNGVTTIDPEEDIDDFESSNEEDNVECPEAQLPAEPIPQYNLTRSLRAAGKRLRQNLTLRKSDLSKSLKKFRPRINTKPESELNSKFYTDLRHPDKRYRPHSPPPPPPSLAPVSLPSTPSSGGDSTGAGSVQYADLRVNGSDLYAECGLFKQRSRSTTLWYTEAGLYGDKVDAKAAPVRDFTDEPLYQFYTECVNAQARDDIMQLQDDDILNHYYTLINDNRKTLDLKVPLQRSLPSFHALNRTLWCQMPEVEASCIVPTLTDQQRKLQEAKFELVTSEGSYIHSLNVLETHFMCNLTDLISPRDQKLLFTNILAVKSVSQRLLMSLETCWRQDIMLMGICDVIREHAERDFEVYVKFCKHHTAVYRTLANLLETNSTFAATVKQLESADVCFGLSLHSFLLLPMQRITRLPLLLGAVLSRLEKQDEEYESCKTAFEVLNKIVKDCDEEATKMEKCEEMLLLSQQLVFPNSVRQIPVISGNRCLVKRGTATLVVGKDDSKLTFGRKLNKLKLHLLLFTDLLLLARSKGRGELTVIDFCARNLVQLEQSSGVHLGGGHVMLLTLLENHENKTAEMMVSFSLESEVTRWQDALSPILSTNPMESVYEAWDCPQMITIYEFTATQPDELSLSIGDMVNVLKKIPDGWYQGERLRDGARGWFPSNHAQEISSPHVRAKNKKLRYKLLSQISQQLNTT